MKNYYWPVPIALFSLLLLSACGFNPEIQTGPLRTDPISVPLGAVEHANVELDLAAGELVLHGNAQALIDGTFEYNVAEWKPLVKTSVAGSHATVTIKEPEGAHPHGNTHYTWDLSLNDKVVLDLTTNCGAGHAKLQLGDLNLRTVEVHMGAGQVDLDLQGTPSRDYDVNIAGGVGQAIVHLPHGVGVRAEAHGGLGSIDVSGLEKKGQYYENSLYDNSKVNVRLKVEGGIGEIQIIG
jgi:hypothetical protein